MSEKEYPYPGFGCQVAVAICAVYAIPLGYLAYMVIYSLWTGETVELIPPHD